jgi:hypothetical protein
LGKPARNSSVSDWKAALLFKKRPFRQPTKAGPSFHQEKASEDRRSPKRCPAKPNVPRTVTHESWSSQGNEAQIKEEKLETYQ